MFTKQLFNLQRPTYNLLKRFIAHNEKGSWQEIKDETTINRGIDLVRESEEAETNLFPLMSQLGVSTTNKIHKFEAHCDQLIKYIKLGAINKNVAIQYCHYLAHLTRSCEASELEYYGKRSIDLATYLVRNSKDVAIEAQVKLLCDISDTSASNCSDICNRIVAQKQLASNFIARDFAKLLASCYKFGLWKIANILISKYSTYRIIVPKVLDQLITALPNSVEIYNNLSQDDRKEFRDNLNEHILEVCEKTRQDRIQFITKYAPEFIKSLDNLGIRVVKNPVIKLSGRCTNCNSFLPMYQHESTVDINRSIKRLLEQKLADKYFLHSSPKDLFKFEEYLNNLYKMDRKPIDLVIDGLNIAYKNNIGIYYIKKSVQENYQVSEKRQNSSSQVQVLINTIIRGNMLQNFRKILVIGRDHMRNWPGLLEFFEKQKIHYYFSSNPSKDDLFQLYAATLNPKTLLITGDFFRDHLTLLDLNERIALERWIDTHQVWIQSKTLKPIWPTPYEKIPSAQREVGHFHVPLIDFHKLETLSEHEPPPHLNNKMTMWTCCKINP